MRRYVIHSPDSDLIFDVSSNDPKISKAASDSIQRDFDLAAIEMHKLLIKKAKRTKLNREGECQ